MWCASDPERLYLSPARTRGLPSFSLRPQLSLPLSPFSSSPSSPSSLLSLFSLLFTTKLNLHDTFLISRHPTRHPCLTTTTPLASGSLRPNHILDKLFRQLSRLTHKLSDSARELMPQRRRIKKCLTTHKN